MSTTPDVTVVLTTKDRPAMLQAAVSSVLRQTHASFELIIVDDGSQDPVRLDVEDDRIRLLRNEHPQGVSAARNSGLAAARGAWITFLDDDDAFEDAFIEQSLAAASRSDLPEPVGTLAGVTVVDAKGKTLAVRTPTSFPKGNSFLFERGIPSGVHNTFFVPTEVFRRIGGWDDRVRAWVHTELFLRLIPECSLEGISTPLYRWTDHAGPRVHRDWNAAANSIARTIEKHRPAFERHPRHLARYEAAMAVHMLRAGSWHAAFLTSSRALLHSRFDRRCIGSWLRTLVGPTLHRSLSAIKGRSSQMRHRSRLS